MVKKLNRVSAYGLKRVDNFLNLWFIFNSAKNQLDVISYLSVVVILVEIYTKIKTYKNTGNREKYDEKKMEAT